MVKLNRIYTRTGDQGTTGLVGGDRVEKDHPRVEGYGDIDELNSCLGICRTIADEMLSPLSTDLANIQQELFDLGAELATPESYSWPGKEQISEENIAAMEKLIDQLTDQVPELSSFVLPGGSKLNAFLHLARTVARRAERNLWRLTRTEKIRPVLITYLNRLSDLLFAMARFETKHSKSKEYLWVPGEKRKV